MAEDTGFKMFVEVSYCPHLGIYHYKHSDGTEYFYDNTQLENVLVVHLSQGHAAEAEWISRLASDAREFPHKIIAFNEERKCQFREPVIPDWVAQLGKSPPPASE